MENNVRVTTVRRNEQIRVTRCQQASKIISYRRTTTRLRPYTFSVHPRHLIITRNVRVRRSNVAQVVSILECNGTRNRLSTKCTIDALVRHLLPIMVLRNKEDAINDNVVRLTNGRFPKVPCHDHRCPLRVRVHLCVSHGPNCVSNSRRQGHVNTLTKSTISKVRRCLRRQRIRQRNEVSRRNVLRVIFQTICLTHRRVTRRRVILYRPIYLTCHG